MIKESTTSFADRVEEAQLGNCRLFVLKVPVQSVVSIQGSFLTYPGIENGEYSLQNLAVSLLDKGTRKRSRFEIAEILESRGAELNFGSQGIRVNFSGRTLPEYLPDVLELIAEQLTEPLFDPEEFEKSRAHIAASIHRSMESTGARASGALTRNLYSQAHPNYSEKPEDELKRLSEYDVDRVRNFHEQHFGARDLNIVLVGDTDSSQVIEIVQELFGQWSVSEVSSRFDTQSRSDNPGQTFIPMPDKSNIDVRMGHGIRVLRQDQDYIPLFMGNFALGGNFSARLMATVRDEMGLTYGIGSSLYGISTQYEGHWQVAVTLSQEKVDEGVSATLKEIRRFVDEGITEQELETIKTTITGSYKVGLATTGGMAIYLLNNAERGFDVGYLDRFPLEVERVSLDTINEVIRRHFVPDQLHIVYAGMVGQEGTKVTE